MNLWSEIAIAALIGVGASFMLVGSIGLAKLPDMMRRLHGPTKATTLGVGALLIASMAFFLVEHDHPSVHELLITLFLFLTAPISAHMMAKAHLLRNHSLRDQLSRSDIGASWATFESAPPGRDGA